MRNRPLAIAGAALAIIVGVGGCGPQSGGGATGTRGTAGAEQPAKPADPAAELAAAATRLADESLKVTMTMATGLNAEGVVNAEGTRMDMTMTMNGSGSGDSTIAMRKIDDDLYMKFAGSLGSVGGEGDKWLHVDSSKLPEGSAFSMQGSNPKDASKMIAATAGVEKTGDRSFKGVLDMTRAPGANARSLESLGAKATAVPFTAQVDAQGRMTELVIDVETLAPGAGTMTTRYSDFGTPVSVEAPPASQVTEMPKEMLGVVGA
jgi:hypothetical protein